MLRMTSQDPINHIVNQEEIYTPPFSNIQSSAFPFIKLTHTSSTNLDLIDSKYKSDDDQKRGEERKSSNKKAEQSSVSPIEDQKKITQTLATILDPTAKLVAPYRPV